MTVKINSLAIENVKRVKAVQMELAQNGLTVIGGRNGQGKTSVLDAIAWALGGDKFKPSNAARDSSTLPPEIHIELSNGLIVERKGVKSALKVIDPSGEKAGQKLLDSFIEKLALDLPKFMGMNSKDKANTLLQIIGIGDELAELDAKEAQRYNRRLEIGRIAKTKRSYADELEYYPDAPTEPVSASDLIKQQQEILAQNGENQRKREQLAKMTEEHETITLQIAQLKASLEEAQTKQESLLADIETAQKTVAELVDESTEELETNIAQVDDINRKVRANQEKGKAQAEAEELSAEYNGLTAEIEAVKEAKNELLNKADLPLPELGVKDGELIYKGQQWDGMSGAEQLMVATAIIRKLNPECGFVLMDKLEQMDQETLKEFSEWFTNEGLQVIATRVGTDDSCSIIIEDGYVKESAAQSAEPKAWTPGTF
jgi:hypothetical protein